MLELGITSFSEVIKSIPFKNLIQRARIFLKPKHISKLELVFTLISMKLRLPSFHLIIPSLMLRFILLFVAVVLRNAKSEVKLPQNVPIPAMLVFGDSIVDSGNNNLNSKTFARSNYPPYGQDFEGGLPTGRFNNGKVPPDLLAEALGIKELIPAYLDPNLQPSELATGVNFASGGAGYDPMTSQIASAIHVSGQLEMFKEYRSKLKEVIGEEGLNMTLANSIFLVVFGSNDIATTYFVARARMLQYDIPTYADFLVNSASDFLKELYELGARRIEVFGVPAVGCVPFVRTVLGGVTRNCAEKVNEAAQIVNAKLLKEIDSLNKNLPQSRIVYIDTYSTLLDLTINHKKYGYKVADRGCCGTGLFEVTMTCRGKHTCPNVSEYVFWDSFHPTEQAYKHLLHPHVHLNLFS